MVMETLPSKATSFCGPAAASSPFRFKSCLLLDQFVPQENPGPATSPIIRKNEAVGQLLSLFPAFYKSEYSHSEFIYYSRACEMMEKISFTPNDLSISSFLLAKYADFPNFSAMAGIFLSAAINTHVGKNFTIDVKNYPEPISCICMHNTKNVTIRGDLGGFQFAYMESGTVTINGNVFGLWGSGMTGGTVQINGNISIRVVKPVNCPEGGNVFQFRAQLVKEGEVIRQARTIL